MMDEGIDYKALYEAERRHSGALQIALRNGWGTNYGPPQLTIHLS